MQSNEFVKLVKVRRCTPSIILHDIFNILFATFNEFFNHVRETLKINKAELKHKKI